MYKLHQSTFYLYILSCFITLGYRKRKYKLYLEDEGMQIPKQTRHNQKIRVANQNTAGPTVFTISSTRGDDVGTDVAELEYDLSTSSANTEQIIANIDPNIDSSEIDIDRHEIDECENISPVDLELESDTSLSSASSLYSDDESEIRSLTSEEDFNSDSDTECGSDSFSSHKSACMAVQSFITRHRITNEAGRDLIELVKVTCPESEVFKSLTHSSMREVCGNCQINVYDICEKCLGLFPCEDKDNYICSTPNCGG